jgi:phage terminase small subunit
MPKLENEKQERFCQEYLFDNNATKAYMRAYPGTKPESADTAGPRLLGNVRISERIQELREARGKRTQVTQDRVVQQLANIAFAELGLVCTWSEAKGLELIDSDDLSPEQRAGIEAIETTPISDGDGGLLGHRRKVQLGDRVAALKLLGLHLGMYNGSGTGGKDPNGAKERLLSAFERAAERLGKRKGKS